MSGKRGRKRISSQEQDLIRMDFEGFDHDGDREFKPLRSLLDDGNEDDDDGYDLDSGDEDDDDGDDSDSYDDSDDESDSDESSELYSEEGSDEDSDDDANGETFNYYGHDSNRSVSNGIENPHEMKPTHCNDKNKNLSPRKDMSGLNTPPGTSNMEEKYQDDCPICLLEFADQLIGQPENCKHLFCLDCIKEWSKTVNSCPVDRQKFNVIKIRKDMGGSVIEELFVEDACPAKEEPEEPPTYCQVCNMCDREDVLLLCDNCDDGYHLDCLIPQLTEVPIGDWHCPSCARETQSTYSQPAAATAEPQRSTRATRRRAARTVAETATFARAARAWFSGEVDASLSTFIGYRPRAARRRSYSRKGKRKTRKKSRRRKKRGDASTSGALQGARASGPSKKRKRRAIKKKRSNTAKKRQVKDNKNAKEERKARPSMLGSASLEPTLSFSLFGNQYDLDVLSEQPEKSIKEEEQEEKRPVPNNPHILTEIFQGFETLDSENVVINRDGSLIPKEKRGRPVDGVAGKVGSESFNKEKVKRKVEIDDEDLFNNGSNISKFIVPGSNGSRSPSTITTASVIKERNRKDIQNDFHRNSRLKKPSLDEIGSWRSLIDKTEYKPLSDVKILKSFKIPKIAKKENNVVKSGGDKCLKPVAAKEESGNSFNNKFNGSRESRPLNRLAGRFDVSRSKEKTILGGEGIGTLKGEGIVNNNDSRKCAKIPSRLTPRIYNTLPSMEKKIDRKSVEQCEGVRRSLPGGLSEVKSAMVARRSSLDGNYGAQGISTERCVQKDKITNDSCIRGSSNACNGREGVEGSKTLVNNCRLAGSKGKTSTTNGTVYANSESRIIKEKRHFVVKKVFELDSDDDDESSGDFTYENSLLETKKVDQDKNTKKISEKVELVPVKEKGVLLETSPEYHWNFDTLENLSTFECGKPFEKYSPADDFSKMSQEAVVKRSVDKKSLNNPVPNSSGSSHGKKNQLTTQWDKVDETKILKQTKSDQRRKRQEHAASEAKKALKPFFRNGDISKEEYKLILKRAVVKIAASHSSINSEKVSRLVLKYVSKLKGIHM